MQKRERTRSWPGSVDLNLIDRFSFLIEGFNLRSLSLRDLYDYCDREEIEIIEKPMRRLHGGSVEERGHRYIYINSLLPYAEQVIAGYHELFHILFSVAGFEVLCSTGDFWSTSKAERQAQTIGVIALMPAALIRGMSTEDIMREFEVSRQIAQFRVSLGI